MNHFQMGAVELNFAQIIWQNEPISSTQLAKLSEQELGWKKSTSFTVLKRLCNKGLFQNNSGTVTSLVSKEDYFSIKTEAFVDETFGGSLPAFLAAFTSRKALTDDDVAQLRRMIEKYQEE